MLPSPRPVSPTLVLWESRGRAAPRVPTVTVPLASHTPFDTSDQHLPNLHGAKHSAHLVKHLCSFQRRKTRRL